MLRYISNKGGGSPVNIETAILNGYAADGGLYVPETLPKVSAQQLEKWKGISYPALAFEVVSLFIDESIVSAQELKGIIANAYDTFEKDEIIPIHKLESKENMYVMELFYGTTLSFKDIGLSFLINLIDFFLKRKQERKSIIVATTGDTGPAAASYIAGTTSLDAWVLYPKGLITEEQERQMTTLYQANIHPVGVYNCPQGGDDLDDVIKKLYANEEFKNKVNLSSVNSINWGRVMIQIVHYFYGYFQIAENVGDDISMVVPSGGFGNLCGGSLARKMGLPIKYLVAANNKNEAINRIFRQGILSMASLHESVSSAIDILIPMNFWRYLFYCVNGDTQKIKHWMEEFDKNGSVRFDKTTFSMYKKGFLSGSASDKETTDAIKNMYDLEGYLLDPHTAVSLVVANTVKKEIGDHKIMLLATAHPSKFPKIIKQSLGCKTLPNEAMHPSIERAKHMCQKGYTVEQTHLEMALLQAMESHWDQNNSA